MALRVEGPGKLRKRRTPHTGRPTWLGRSGGRTAIPTHLHETSAARPRR